MSNQEAIEVLKNPSKVKCYVLDKAISKAIEALEKQERIKNELDYLKERDPYGIMLISDVIKLFEECEVEDD